jgi:DNA-binding GntR family transcriptional regulator
MVPAFDARRARDLLAARLALEHMLLDRAMERIDADGIDRLEDILSRATDGPGRQPDLIANHDFHFALYRHAESEVLLPMVEALWLQYGAYLNLIINRPSAGLIAEHAHHRELVTALRARDPAAAHAALEADITRSFNFLLPEG